LAPTGEAGSGPAPAATPAWGALPFVLKMPHLAYVPSGRRDLRLDFLRGFCALAMIVDHIGGASWLYALTGGNRFFTSAAEGFIFISGLVVASSIAASWSATAWDRRCAACWSGPPSSICWPSGLRSCSCPSPSCWGCAGPRALILATPRRSW